MYKISHMKSYVDMGDCIYMLLFCKILNIKNIYLDGKSGITKFNNKNAEFLMPLIKYQSYIESCDLYENQLYNCEYATIKSTLGEVATGVNLLEFHAKKFNLNINSSEFNLPWIHCPKLEGFKYKVVINRTERYHGRYPWMYDLFLKTIYPFSDCIFVGLPEEYNRFKEDYKVDIPYYETSTALELARVINSSDTFFGNESLACAIAKGLGKNCFVEISPWAANYLFLNKNNIFYFG